MENGSHSVTEWLQANRSLLVGLIITQVVAYGSLFTTVVLTDHTLPNTWLVGYPSFKTYSEGRWLADIIIRLQGGSGVQHLQMAAAVCLQAVNAVLFARLLGIVRPVDVFLAGLFLCLYPAFLDYYSFSIDHLTFCIGDTLVLAGAMLIRFRPGLRSAAAATVLFSLSLAAYQPKLSLVLLMLAIVELFRIVEGDGSQEPERMSALLRRFGGSLAIAGGTVLLYALSLTCTLRQDGGVRTHINTPPEFLTQAIASPGVVWQAMTNAPYLPGSLRLLPVVVVALGTLVLIAVARSRGPVAVAGVVVLVGAMPLALRAAYLVNHETWRDSGRITFTYGYALLFFLAAGLRWPPLRPAVVAIMGLFVYVFFVLATQESGAAAMKTTYETQRLAWIAARAEDVAGTTGRPRPLVVVGMYPEFPRHQFVPRKGVIAQMQRPAFASYRQVEMLNFFLGRTAFRKPTSSERAAALRSAEGRQPWPSPDAVYVVDDTVVILLEPFRKGVSVTKSGD